jgi:hypothetical protein
MGVCDRNIMEITQITINQTYIVALTKSGTLLVRPIKSVDQMWEVIDLPGASNIRSSEDKKPKIQ